MLNQPAGFSTAGGAGGSTAVDATLTSAGSTRLAGRFTVENPTTAVTVANPTTAVTVSSGVVLGPGSSANTLGAVAQAPGSTSIAPWYVISTAAAGAGSTTVDANLTSAGSTKLAGRVTVDNPTTAVTVSSGVVLGAGSSANVLGSVAQAPGSTSIAPWYVISTAAAGAGSTTVDANLTSAGSTRVVGTVSLSSAASTNSVAAFTVANPTTAVTVNVSSAVDATLTSAGSTRVVGTVSLASAASTNSVAAFTVANPTTSVTVSSGVVLGNGSTANMIGTVTLSTINQNVDLSSAGSTRLVGVNNYESFTVASRTSVASSADIALFAASTAVRSRVISAISTGADLLVNLSTNVVSSASSGHDIRITAGGYFTMGGQTGNMPLYVGAVRVKVNSTAVNSVAVGLQFTT